MTKEVTGTGVPAIPSDDRFLTAAQTRARYGGVSDMWLWRRLHDGSDFPQPLILNKRRYWRLADLTAWERAQSEFAKRQSPV